MLRVQRLASAIAIAALFSVPASAPAQDAVEREFKECPECPVMLGIPSGSFIMGSPADEPGRFDTEGPQHEVTVKAFALGKYNLTTEEFLLFLKETGYQPEPCNRILRLGWRSPSRGLAYPPFVGQPARWPAACLDWTDAQAYIAWLNQKVRAHRPELAGREGPYRLPSEAEWEFAARAGTSTARWWGNDIGVNRANCNGCGSPWDYKVLAEVDAFAPNPFGLYGMLGNVWHWTEDCWHESYAGAPNDGSAWSEQFCDRHVVRGGSWNNLPIFVRSAARSGGTANGGEYDYAGVAGFRVARDLP
jgi:formylglycine-generating enzyme required for sulfatase activity